MHKLISVILFAFALIFGAAGCSGGQTPSTTPTTTDPTSEMLSYATPAAEAMMQAFSENDRDKYIQYGNDAFKVAVTQQVFEAAAAPVNAQLGSFVSVQFLSTEMQDQYTIVHYTAKFENGDVGLRMVFDTSHLVAGQFFE